MGLLSALSLVAVRVLSLFDLAGLPFVAHNIIWAAKSTPRMFPVPLELDPENRTSGTGEHELRSQGKLRLVHWFMPLYQLYIIIRILFK